MAKEAICPGCASKDVWKAEATVKPIDPRLSIDKAGCNACGWKGIPDELRLSGEPIPEMPEEEEEEQ